MHLVRHPLSALLVILVVLFFVFFLLAPLLHLIFDLLVIAAIIWAVMEQLQSWGKSDKLTARPVAANV